MLARHHRGRGQRARLQIRPRAEQGRFLEGKPGKLLRVASPEIFAPHLPQTLVAVFILMIKSLIASLE